MRVYDEPVDNVDKSGARRKASRLRHFGKVVPSRLRRRRKQRNSVYKQWNLGLTNFLLGIISDIRPATQPIGIQAS